MPRISRELIGSAFVHNMVQGINRENIFQEENYKNKYIRLMKKYCKKYEVSVIAYCIMDNHAHILTHSENIKNISLFMKETNTEYAIYYNKLNNRVGYVFRNRFHSKSIYSQQYLLKCIKYIHMNPEKAGMSKEKDYKFSSYKDYINPQDFIDQKILKLVFNSENAYLEKFKSINYEPLNIEQEDSNIEDVLNMFLIQKNLNLSQIQKDSILIKKFISYLISNECKFSKTDIAKTLKISRANLYRKLKGDDK